MSVVADYPGDFFLPWHRKSIFVPLERKFSNIILGFLGVIVWAFGECGGGWSLERRQTGWRPDSTQFYNHKHTDFNDFIESVLPHNISV